MFTPSESIQAARSDESNSEDFVPDLLNSIWESALNCQSLPELFQKSLLHLRMVFPSLRASIWTWNEESGVWKLSHASLHRKAEELPQFEIAGESDPKVIPPDAKFLADIKPFATQNPVGEASSEEMGMLIPTPITNRNEHNDYLVLWGANNNWNADILSTLSRQLKNTLLNASNTILKVEKYRRADAIYSAVFQSTPLAMISVGTDLICRTWNFSAEQLFRKSKHVAIGSKVVLSTGDHQEQLNQTIQRCIGNRFPLQLETICVNTNGKQFPAKVFVVPVISQAEKVTEVILMIRDESEISAAKQELEAPVRVSSVLSKTDQLQDSWQKILSVIVDTLKFEAGAVWKTVDDEERFELHTRSASNSTTLDHFQSFRDLSDLTFKAIKAGEIVWKNEQHEFPAEIGFKDASYTGIPTSQVIVPVLYQDKIHSVLTFETPLALGLQYGQSVALKTIQQFLRNTITKEEMLRTVEDQKESIRQTKKMEALGVMAGGIAHDFNNLLTVILGNTELAMFNLEQKDSKWNLLKEIQHAGERASSLTKRLLTFSRKRISEASCMHLNRVISTMTPMLKTVLGEKIALETSFQPGCHPVMMDPVEFEQIIMNLTANARDAMPEGGRFTIELTNQHISNRDVSAHPEIQPGDYLLLKVKDTGTGMTKETKARIFEPFYTTKEVERGTGLGLATVHGIIKGSGGMITVDTELNRGTEFSIYLPRTSMGIAPSFINDEAPTLIKGTESILIVEDEEVLGRLISRILEVRGFQVQLFHRGEAAIKHFKKHKKSIDLILTDVMMPGFSGSDVIREAKKINPEIQLLVMSGYNDSETLSHQLQDLPPILEKPFSSEALVQAIHNTLHEAEHVRRI